MQLKMNIITYILPSCVFIAASIKYMNSLLQYRAKNKWSIWIVAIFYLCVMTLSYFSESELPINAALFIAMISSFGCFYSKWKRIAVAISFLVVALFISEAMIFYLIQLINDSIAAPITEEQMVEWCGVVSKLVVPIILYIFAKIFQFVFSKEPIPARYLTGCLSIPLLSVFVLYYIHMSSSSKNLPIAYSLSAAAVIMTMNTLILFIFIRLTEYYSAKIANQKYVEQIDAFNNQQLNNINAITAIKQTRHDLNNILLAVKISLAKENIKEALDAVEDHLNEANPVYFVSNTNIYSIDSIINYKNEIARRADIRIVVHNHHIEELKINWMDVCVIMSSALDNAIEACKQVESHEEKVIRIGIDIHNRMLHITITNPYIGEIVTNEQGRYLTTKSDKENHGFGVGGIMRLLEKNNGYGEIDNSNNLFELKFIIPEFQLTSADRK